jgi:dCTP deaminase
MCRPVTAVPLHRISPRSFSIPGAPGLPASTSCARCAARRARPATSDSSDAELRHCTSKAALVDSEPTVRDGINLRVDLTPQTRQRLIGYKAKRYAGVVDVDHVGGYDTAKFWDEIYDDEGGRLILDPHEFYILASKEAVVVPSQYAAEMAPFDPMMGEFRVHYAGFFDPDFGVINGKPKSARAVLEVRSLDIPFIPRTGHGRLCRATSRYPGGPLRPGAGPSYQAQGLKLPGIYVAGAPSGCPPTP